MIEPVVQTFMLPALRKLREERGTPILASTVGIKGWATRPPVVTTASTRRFNHG
jgi:hypothetical protein